ncbi:MAG: isochorismatase family protein [Rhizobiales bacterium]|nr:isochorismatase family protein [Hyphomicrobiales bacterium]
MTLEIDAQPEPIAFDPKQSALIVVDMQNGYCSPGGYFSHLGIDLSPFERVVGAISRLVSISRDSGMQVIWLQNGWDPQLKEAGGPHSVNQRKGNSLRLMRERSELRGKLLTKGGWDYEIVDALKPDAEDIIVPKPRYSGFAGTALDSILRSRRIETLFVCGVATNVCVESTIREAFFKEFFPVLVRDACYQAGPQFIQDATVYNVEKFFGWTALVEDIAKVCRHAKAA